MRRVVLVSALTHRPGHFWPNVKRLAEQLAKAGFRVTVVCSGTPTPKPEGMGSEIDVVPLSRLAARGLRFLASGGPLRRKIEQALATLLVLRLAGASIRNGDEPPIWVQVSDVSHVPAFWWLSRAPAPVVLYRAYGGPDRRLGRRGLLRYLFRRAVERGCWGVLVETDLLRREWCQLVGERCWVVPYVSGLPTLEELEPRRWRELIGLPVERPCFLVFGPVRGEKRIDTVVEAAALIATPVTLLLVGKGWEGTDARLRAARLGFEGLRVVDRFVGDREAAAYFRAADAVVLPYEGRYTRGSGVLVDACSAGRPVLVSRTGYLAEFVRHYGCGLTFDPASPGELADRMREVLEPEVWARCVRGAAKARAEHTWDMVLARYAEILRVLSEGRR
jgi:glycosyltransferase involved in cell wall biosynthesis